jgi:hypothetical protein
LPSGIFGPRPLLAEGIYPISIEEKTIVVAATIDVILAADPAADH